MTPEPSSAVPMAPSPTGPRQKSPREIALTILAIALGVWASSHWTSNALGQATTVDDALAQACAIANKKLPMLVDKETRLDSENDEPGRVIHYHYTLVHLTTEQAAKLNLQHLKPHMLENYRKSASMKFFRENGVSMIYDYLDMSGKPIGTIKITPADLK